MLKTVLGLLAVLNTADACAKTLKLGDMINNPTPAAAKRVRLKGEMPEISCLSNGDCPFDRECVALRCLDVCTKDTCSEPKKCIAHKKRPHEYMCVDCVYDSHCEKGFECSRDTFTCVEKDVCRDAVCSPAAPYCIQVPYKTLPYTCVQCLTDEHCPPVAGLSRSCIDNFCLFNVENNIPRKTERKTTDLVQTEEEPLYETEESLYEPEADTETYGD